MRLAFRFRVIPFIATVALVTLGIALGNWQARRAEEKGAIAARVAARSSLAPPALGPREQTGTMAFACGGWSGDAALAPPADKTERFLRQTEYCRLRTTGEFVAAWPLFLDNRPYGGRAGFVLAMPFKIAGSNDHIIVLRGWLPRDPRDYAHLPAFTTPKGKVEIEGIVLRSAGHVMQLGTPGVVKPGAIVQNLTPGEVARASGLRVSPYFVQQQGLAGAADGGLVRDWPSPSLGIDKHRGYAFQWYALAAMAALFFVITGFRSGRKQGV